MNHYKQEEIDVVFGAEIKKKHIQCDALPLLELKKLLENGWVIYDTQPVFNNEDVKILMLVKG